jgi:hypothetical protein
MKGIASLHYVKIMKEDYESDWGFRAGRAAGISSWHAPRDHQFRWPLARVKKQQRAAADSRPLA